MSKDECIDVDIIDDALTSDHVHSYCTSMHIERWNDKHSEGCVCPCKHKGVCALLMSFGVYRSVKCI